MDDSTEQPQALTGHCVRPRTRALLINSERFSPEAGDAVFFEADVPREYYNPGDRDLLMYLVMTYA